MNTQNQQIKFLKRLMQLGNRPAWAKPLCRLALKFAFPRLQLVPPESYFSEVMKATGIRPKHSLSHYREELIADIFLKEKYQGAIAAGKLHNKYKHYEQRFNHTANVVNYYALLRELRPDYVVETGTATGSMTSWILKALHENKNGTLISIDLPPVANTMTMDISVASEDLGFLIPELYKKHWDLHLGDAKVLLPKILTQTPVDVFIHDSLHTTTHMAFEYNVARALLKPGALILSDDTLWNHAWYQFLKTHHLKGMACEDNVNLGFTVNLFDDYEKIEGLGVFALNS